MNKITLNIGKYTFEWSPNDFHFKNFRICPVMRTREHMVCGDITEYISWTVYYKNKYICSYENLSDIDIEEIVFNETKKLEQEIKELQV